MWDDQFYASAGPIMLVKLRRSGDSLGGMSDRTNGLMSVHSMQHMA
jgi:hypothetical protein